MPRLNKVNIIVGRRGCGKTELILKVINAIGNSKRVLIIDTIDHPKYINFQIIEPYQVKGWIKGTKRILVKHSNLEQIFHEVFTTFKNGVVIFEDCTKYIKRKLPVDLLDFVIDTKQKNVDLHFLYHSFAAVPPDLFRNADNITTFKTQENIETCKSKLPNYDVCKTAWHKVMKDKNPHKYITFQIN